MDKPPSPTALKRMEDRILLGFALNPRFAAMDGTTLGLATLVMPMCDLRLDLLFEQALDSLIGAGVLVEHTDRPGYGVQVPTVLIKDRRRLPTEQAAAILAEHVATHGWRGNKELVCVPDKWTWDDTETVP